MMEANFDGLSPLAGSFEKSSAAPRYAPRAGSYFARPAGEDAPVCAMVFGFTFVGCPGRAFWAGACAIRTGDDSRDASGRLMSRPAFPIIGAATRADANTQIVKLL